MTILVTGAGGMVGSHMVEQLSTSGFNVIGTYYKPTVMLDEISKDIQLIECDVRYCDSVYKILEVYKPDKIFHLAAQSYPTVSWERPYETIDTNINGTVAVFEGVKRVRRVFPEYDPMVVVACSSAEYGASLEKLDSDKVKETTELLPLHPYGVSKVGQDLLAFQYFMNEGIRTIRARIFNTTGPRKVNDVTSDFTKRAVLADIENKFELRIGNLNTYRAIMDVRDLISALVLLSDKGTPGEAYNISSEHVYRMADIVTAIESQMGVSFKLSVDQALLRPTDERIIVGDVTKLKCDTGWHQKISLEVTVSDMLVYWRMKLAR